MKIKKGIKTAYYVEFIIAGTSLVKEAYRFDTEEEVRSFLRRMYGEDVRILSMEKHVGFDEAVREKVRRKNAES